MSDEKQSETLHRALVASLDDWKEPIPMTDTQAPDVVVTEVRASIWQRDDEWVLELSGTIDDTNFVSRHTEPLTTAKADVAGLPTLYDSQSAMQARIEKLEADLGGLLKWADNVCRALGIATDQLAVERARATLSNIGSSNDG